MDVNKNRAAAIVSVVSTLLIAGALLFQTLGYQPCEMCLWQRWAHAATAVAATGALALGGAKGRILVMIAILCILAGGMLGIFHAGVEWKLWEGVTTCATNFSSRGGDILVEIMKAPLVRCDEAAWRFLGISMAGYNALISLGTAILASAVLLRSAPAERTNY
jgi:disulfide bond formation protein DsbB